MSFLSHPQASAAIQNHKVYCWVGDETRKWHSHTTFSVGARCFFGPVQSCRTINRRFKFALHNWKVQKDPTGSMEMSEMFGEQYVTLLCCLAAVTH